MIANALINRMIKPVAVLAAVIAALLFVAPASGATVQQAKLIASNAAGNDAFGFSASVDGNRAVVGARNGDGNVADSGSAYEFRRVGAS